MPSNLPKLALFLTSEAIDDIQDIFQFTLETWGEKQACYYKDKIDNTFKLIQNNPEIGRRKDNYFVGCYCFAVEKHIVFYRIKDQSIQVVRLLHSSRDIERLF
jgi:toxin ParE1/3/4